MPIVLWRSVGVIGLAVGSWLFHDASKKRKKETVIRDKIAKRDAKFVKKHRNNISKMDRF